MNQFNKEILDALSSDSKTSLKDVFRNQLEQTVNTLITSRRIVGSLRLPTL